MVNITTNYDFVVLVFCSTRAIELTHTYTSLLVVKGLCHCRTIRHCYELSVASDFYSRSNIKLIVVSYRGDDL